MIAPTLLGHVGAVTGGTISVRQIESVASGIAIIGGRSYRVGQVGSFVRIPQGYHDLYGVIAEVGAAATPNVATDVTDRGDRWLTVQLVGEIVEVAFERGISQFPAINDEVHLVTEDDLAKIYGTADKGQITVGRLAGAESIAVRLDLDKLVARHSAVVGSTGSGKSTSVASLMHSLTGPDASGFPSSRILLLDIHGEYATALRDVAQVFRVNPDEAQGERHLYVPYWAISIEQLLPFLMGRLEEKAESAILDRILQKKLASAKTMNALGVDENSLTAEAPLPFSLKQLWFELIDPEIKTWLDQQRTQTAIEANGDAETLTAPRYPLPGMGNTSPFTNNAGVLSIRRPLDHMRTRLLDRQYDFMLHPGPWEPDLAGVPEKDLADLLEDWLGHETYRALQDVAFKRSRDWTLPCWKAETTSKSLLPG